MTKMILGQCGRPSGQYGADEMAQTKWYGQGCME